MLKVDYFEKSYNVFSDSTKFTEVKNENKKTHKKTDSELIRALIKPLKIVKNKSKKIISGCVNT